MGIKSPIHIKILNDTLDIVTLMTRLKHTDDAVISLLIYLTSPNFF